MGTNTKTAALSATVIAVTLLSATACSTAESESSNPQTGTVRRAEMSVAHRYTSIEDLAKASTARLVVEALPGAEVAAASRSGTGSILSTITKVRVKEVQGSKSIKVGDTLSIRQTGTGVNDKKHNQYVDDILNPGNTYAIFVAPFHFEEGDSTGQYVIVNDTSYVYDMASGKGRIYASGDRQESGVPEVITEKSLELDSE